MLEAKLATIREIATHVGLSQTAFGKGYSGSMHRA